MRFAIFGLGNIGIPLTCIFASLGQVIGADIDQKKVDMINKGECPLPNEERVPELLKKYVNEGKISATTDLNYAAKNSDVKIIIVPLLLTDDKKPDFSVITNVTKIIGKKLKKNDIVIVSTTMPIGATRCIIGKILENESKLKMGDGFYLVYVPERTMNPHVIEDLTEKWHQIIGGANKSSADKAKEIYDKINKKGVIVVRDCETAEMIKLMEGVYRYTNIALANEVALICEKFKIDFIEVMKNFNLIPVYNLHKAGVGVGGHCIPVYPCFVLEHVEGSDLIRPSIEINKKMPKHSIDLIKREFGSLENKKIGILGLSYRGGIKEDRLSPSYDLIKILKSEKADIFVHDPFYSKEEIKNKTKEKYMNINEINEMDIVIVATDHEEYKNLNFGGKIKLLFDGKGFLDPDNVKSKGIKYVAVGRVGI